MIRNGLFLEIEIKVELLIYLNCLLCIIKFSTSDNAFRVHGLVRSILVISSYTFV